MRRRLIVFLAVTLGTIFPFALAESGLRLYRAAIFTESTFGAPPMCEVHPTRIWQYKAGWSGRQALGEFDVAVRTNTLRLRGPEPHQGASRRILVIGDSFTFGWGVEEAERYSERLAEALGPDVEVVNAGHWSYTFDQQYLLLRELLPTLRPALVVQGFYWLHVSTLSARRWRTDARGRLLATTQSAIRVDDRGQLRFRSDFIERPPFGSLLIAFTARHLLNWELARQSLLKDQGLITPGYRDADELWAMTGEMVRQTRDLLAEHRVAWLPFTVPHAITVSEQEWDARAIRQALKGKDLGLPSRRLAGIFAEAGVELVDLLPSFQRGYTPTLYFVHDLHWKADGHRLAAAELLPAVRVRSR